MSDHKGKTDKKISPKTSQKPNIEIRFLYGTTDKGEYGINMHKNRAHNFHIMFEKKQ